MQVLQKKMILKRNERNHIMSERNVLLKNLHHPFLVGLHFSFQTSDKLYFVLDYVNGGEVSRLVSHGTRASRSAARLPRDAKERPSAQCRVWSMAAGMRLRLARLPRFTSIKYGASISA